MKRLILAAALLSLLLASRSARAQCTASNTVCITPGPDTAAFLGAAGVTMNQVLSQIDGLFQATNVNSFLHGFQNAQSFSSRGLGVDYASEATLVEAGATLSVASNVDKAYKPSGSYTDPPVSGGGANFSLMGGVGLGLVGLDPVMLFGNWFKGSATVGQLDGDYQNWGLHAQLRLLGPSRGVSATKLLVRWGGIAITSGVDYGHLQLSTSKNITSTINVAAGAPVTVTSAGNLTFSLSQTTYSVPLEVTTSLRLLSLVTVYGGIGLDWQLGGGSDMTIAMAGATLTGAYQGRKFDLGTAAVNAKGNVKPDAARMREIFGVQLGLFDVIRLFAQVNTTASSPMLTSLALGLRLAI
jgi:hypothetical protein